MIAFWFRRDLRLEDNRGLSKAMDEARSRGSKVLPLFIFDKEILRHLPKADARVEFIRQRLSILDQEIRELGGGGLHVECGSPLQIWKRLFQDYKIQVIYCNEDYEPYALKRDLEVQKLSAAKNILFHSYKDQVIFAKAEIAKDNGEPYRIFTPYAKKWLSKLTKQLTQAASLENPNFAAHRALSVPSLEQLGFVKTRAQFPALKFSPALIADYAKTRDRMDLDATSHLGLHLRFGTISVRKLVQFAEKHSQVYLKELIWREFFMQIMHHFPETTEEPFDSRYANIKWRNNEPEFNRWREGRTGVPIVDAGMRQLNETGFMHNRARMIVGSYLTKHLLIDWRRGERYFAEKLLDFELSSNVGNWQWVAGCGCDAAPYFRVFNPMLQAEKFDPAGGYVRKWVPEVGDKDYPEPIVDLEQGRRRALLVYRAALATMKGSK